MSLIFFVISGILRNTFTIWLSQTNSEGVKVLFLDFLLLFLAEATQYLFWMFLSRWCSIDFFDVFRKTYLTKISRSCISYYILNYFLKRMRIDPRKSAILFQGTGGLAWWRRHHRITSSFCEWWCRRLDQIYPFRCMIALDVFCASHSLSVDRALHEWVLRTLLFRAMDSRRYMDSDRWIRTAARDGHELRPDLHPDSAAIYVFSNSELEHILF